MFVGPDSALRSSGEPVPTFPELTQRLWLNKRRTLPPGGEIGAPLLISATFSLPGRRSEASFGPEHPRLFVFCDSEENGKGLILLTNSQQALQSKNVLEK